MALNEYITFLIVAISYIASPGPAVFIALNFGLNNNVKSAIFLFLGNTLGLGILAFISAIGVGSIIVSSPVASNVLKILGALFLIYLGIKMIKSKPKIETKAFTKKKSFLEFKEGVLLALGNPKPIIFFLSIYPQFIKEGNNVFFDFLLLAITFMICSFLILLGYVLISKYFLHKRIFKYLGKINIFSGVTLIVIAFLLLLT